MIFGLSLLYWGLWLAILILWMGRFVTSFLSIYLVSALRLDEGVVGTVVAMYGFGAIIGCLFGGTLSDRFGRQSMIIIGEIGAAAALLVVSVLTDPVSLGAALFVYGAFASLPSPAIAAYIADVVPAERQQRAYVLQSWAINFGYAIGPIVANQLVKIGVKVYTYNNGFMHAKTIIVDDKYATVGSVNQDYRSYDLNFEDNVFVYDRAFNKEMSDQFEKDMEQSTLLTPEMIKKQSRWLRSLQNFSRLLSPIL